MTRIFRLKEEVRKYVKDFKGDNPEEYWLGFGFTEEALEEVPQRIGAVSNTIATEYAEFCVRCDREKLPLLCLEDYVKQYCS